MFSTKETVLELFDQIERDDHQGRVQFYEENTQAIFTLEESKQQYFSFYYIDSLFEIGKYDSVIAEIDDVIEYVFLNNVKFLPVNTFEHLLFIKANTLHKLLHLQEAAKIVEQLIGIHPNETKYTSYLKRIYRDIFNYNSSGIRLATIILIFLSAIASAVLWFSNKGSVSGENVGLFMIVLCPCLLAIILMVGSYCYHIHKSIRKVDFLVASKKEKLKKLRMYA